MKKETDNRVYIFFVVGTLIGFVCLKLMQVVDLVIAVFLAIPVWLLIMIPLWTGYKIIYEKAKEKSS